MKPALYKSLVLHMVVILLFMIDLPLFWRRDIELSQPMIIVDLEQVKISEVTNLPSKAKFGEEEKQATKVKITPPIPQPKPQPKPEPKPQPKPEPQAPEMIDTENKPQEEKPLPPKESFIVPPQPAKPKLPDKKPEPPKPQPVTKPKQEPAKPAPKKEEKKPAKEISSLKNLLDSVSALEKTLGEKDSEAVIKTGTKTANMGIEGGIGGSYFSELSISETDAIAARLRQCWNLDPGAMGIEGMIVEITARLNKDGTVRQVDIVDTSRYNSDVHFRAVADSARRAVYICQPYDILAKKYGDKYGMWETMRLRFDPISHTVK